MKIKVVRCDGNHETLTLTEPLQVRRGEGLNVLEVSTGACHFFTQDGLYDGWDMPVSFEQRESTGLSPEIKGFIDAVELDREIEPPLHG